MSSLAICQGSVYCISSIRVRVHITLYHCSALSSTYLDSRYNPGGVEWGATPLDRYDESSHLKGFLPTTTSCPADMENVVKEHFK